MLTDMGFQKDLASKALVKGRSVAAALDALWPEPTGERERKSREACEQEYVARARDELGANVEVVDLGVAAGPWPRTNACMWLSVVAGASRVLCPRAGAPDATLWAQIHADVAAVRATEPALLRQEGRRAPRSDPVGVAADKLRGHLCAAMATDAGKARFWPFFAQLSGRRNAPGGGGVAGADYARHCERVRENDFADELNLLQCSEALGIRIQVVPSTPLAAPAPWAIATVNPLGSTRTVLLGNNDRHYVWLMPVARPPPASGVPPLVASTLFGRPAGATSLALSPSHSASPSPPAPPPQSASPSPSPSPPPIGEVVSSGRKRRAPRSQDWTSDDPAERARWQQWYVGPRTEATHNNTKTPISLRGCVAPGQYPCTELRPCKACTSNYANHKRRHT